MRALFQTDSYKVVDIVRNSDLGSRPFFGWVTACVPHFECLDYVRHAVESLLAQSYPWLRVVVVNDGIASPPWEALGSITDRRLLRFNLSRHHGPYFALEVARRATHDPFFLIQDADDWSDPSRVEVLLGLLIDQHADFAVSAQPQFELTDNGELVQTDIRWSNSHDSEWGKPLSINRQLSEHFLYRVPHAGLFRSKILERIGGYYGGHLVTWDTMVTNFVLMLGKVAWTPLPLYNRLVRQSSLSHAQETGTGSDYQKEVRAVLTRRYGSVYAKFKRYKRGRLSVNKLEARIKAETGRSVSATDQAILSTEAARLRKHILEMDF